MLITGASSGIGAAVARELAAQGARLSLAARRLELLESLLPELLKLGAAAAQCFRCDVSERQEVLELAASARTTQGEIDVWVSNAGAGLRQRVLELSEEQMLAQFRLNCLSALWAYQALVPQWLATGHAGQIIDICSLGGKSGYAFNGAYSAAKHGMSALGDTLRQELAGSPISITTIYPGPTVSEFGANAPDLTGGAATGEVSQSRSSSNPLARGISSRQSTAQVARAIVHSMHTRQPTVYPHRWGNVGILLNSFCPTLVLRLLARQRSSS